MQIYPIQRERLTALFAGRLYAGAGVWLLAGVVGPCDEPAPSAQGTVEQKAPVVEARAPTIAKSAQASAAAPHAPGTAPSQTSTTRRYMLTHYADTVAMRRAVIAGSAADYRAAAAAVANDGWKPRLRGDYQPYVDAVRAAARSAETAPSSGAAATKLGKLGEACASCHLEFGGPGSPVAPDQLAEGIDPTMVAHAAATNQLWEGLVWPSDIAWASGMEGLLDAPKLDSDVADVAMGARHLRDLARRGKRAEVAQRGQIFANVLTTCAGCHERVGIVLRPTTSP